MSGIIAIVLFALQNIYVIHDRSWCIVLLRRLLRYVLRSSRLLLRSRTKASEGHFFAMRESIFDALTMLCGVPALRSLVVLLRRRLRRDTSSLCVKVYFGALTMLCDVPALRSSEK